MADRGLSLSPEKTKITHIDEGFDFLGWNIRKYNGKLLTKPSKKNVQAFLQDIRETVKANKQATQEKLIKMLNPKIQGFANYHKPSVAKEIFSKVDHEIWKTLWQWANRRHPNKGKHWIKARYFKTEGNRHWVFSTQSIGMEGKPTKITLVMASDTRIRRHTKIKSTANPFDPKDEIYFENRWQRKMNESYKGRKKLAEIWINQDMRCPVCSQRIEENGTIHYLYPYTKGGKDNTSNLAMVHLNCHKRIHAENLTVVKPAPPRGLLEA